MREAAVKDSGGPAHRVGLLIRPVVALVLLASAAGGWWYLDHRSPVDAALIAGSGTIEVDEVSIMAEAGGRVEQVAVAEGAAVHSGELLIALDSTLLDAQERQAQAALEVAQANLTLVEKGTRAEEIRQAEAALGQAVAQRDAAHKAWQNAQGMRDDPQDLTAKINAARPQVTAAEARLDLLKRGARAEDIQAAEKQLDQARNALWATQIDRDGICGNGAIPEYQCNAANARVAAGETGVEAAQVNLNKLKAGPRPEEVQQAEAAVAEARGGLRDLLAMRDNPRALNAQIDAAYGQYQTAEAAAQAAQARLDALKAGPVVEQLAVARAQVRQAEAALGVVAAQKEKMKVKAPGDGHVTRLMVKAGETATPGMRLLTMANLESAKLTVYVPESRIGRVNLGQPVQITVDSFPGETFSGEVVYIAAKAEFTPRNVQSKSERANTVFAVKVKIPNPERKLKAGMPADAQLAQ